MSEAAKKRRQKYRQLRRKKISIQLAVILLLGVVLGWSALTLYRLSETSYISLSEQSSVNYRVHLKENDFYEDEWLGSNQAYVASLIDEVAADFAYKLKVADQAVDFRYSYSVNAKLEIMDEKSKKVIFDPSFPLVETVSKQQSGTELSIKETVLVDYETYNRKAQEFISTLGLESTSSTLLIQMNVKIEGACDAAQSPAKTDYVISLNVPLTQKTVDVHMTSTVPNGENRLLACKQSENLSLYKWLTLGLSGAEVILIAILISFSAATRNQDINYTLRVKRLLASYRSFIQQMEDPFDTNGYRVIRIKTFGELLGIRDTIQSPVLMHENIDKTRTQFFVPTSSQLLYLYEIKVDDYDEIYREETAATSAVAAPAKQTAKKPAQGKSKKQKGDSLSGAIVAGATIATCAMLFGKKK